MKEYGNNTKTHFVGFVVVHFHAIYRKGNTITETSRKQPKIEIEEKRKEGRFSSRNRPLLSIAFI